MTTDQEAYPIWIGDAIWQALQACARQECVETQINRLTRTEERILAYLHLHPYSTTAELAAYFSVNSKAISERMRPLKQRSLVEAIYESSTGGKIARWRAR